MRSRAKRDIELLVIPLAALLEHSDPMLDDPWSCGRIDPQDVLNEVGYAATREAPPEYDEDLYGSYEYNVGRIAHFLQEGWKDIGEDAEPIALDIGLGDYTPSWLISDGNHRVAAAKLRGDRSIAVEIIGELAKAKAVFLRGVSPAEYSSLGLEFSAQ